VGGGGLAGCKGRVPPRCTEARTRALAPGGTAPGVVGLWPLIGNKPWGPGANRRRSDAASLFRRPLLTGEWGPSAASAGSAVDPYIA
jgi:hypothetical protein